MALVKSARNFSPGNEASTSQHILFLYIRELTQALSFVSANPIEVDWIDMMIQIRRLQQKGGERSNLDPVHGSE